MKLFDRAIMELSWQQVRRTPKFWLALLVSLAPLAAGIITVVSDGLEASQRGPGEAHPTDHFAATYTDTWSIAVAYTALPLAALLLAGGLMADDVEDRTLSYLLVRPISRMKLYLSKLLPIALATAALGVLQSLLLGLARVVAWLLYGYGDAEMRPFDQDLLIQGLPQETVDTGFVLFASILGGVVAAALLGMALAALFGFVSLCTTRFHFVANLLAYLFVEIPFSQLGGLGIGILTPTYHALSLQGAFDPSYVGAQTPNAAPGWLAALGVMLIAAGWAWAGQRLARHRDFNVTSAAT